MAHSEPVCQIDVCTDWARAFVARVAAFDRLTKRLADTSVEDANEESALTLDVLVRDARIALGLPVV